ncbi:MAG: 2-oxoacid:acceptor oxidoreductase family protein [Xanthobacteraceae bacterium]
MARRPEDIHAIRMPARGADLVLGGDIVIAAGKKVLAAVKPGTTRMVVNLAEMLPGDFTRNADYSLPSARLRRAIEPAAGAEHCHFVNASRIATALLGQSIGANFFLLGFSYQIGALPLSAEAIEQAIALNGEAVEMNQGRFAGGAAPRSISPPSKLWSSRRRTPRTPRSACRNRSRSWWRGGSIISRRIKAAAMPGATGSRSSACRPPKRRRRQARPVSPKRSRAICSS